jgi:hypothetical protein
MACAILSNCSHCRTNFPSSFLVSAHFEKSTPTFTFFFFSIQHEQDFTTLITTIHFQHQRGTTLAKAMRIPTGIALAALFGLAAHASAAPVANSTSTSPTIINCTPDQTKAIQSAKEDALKVTGWIIDDFNNSSNSTDFEAALRTWFGADANTSHIASVYQSMHDKLYKDQVAIVCPAKDECHGAKAFVKGTTDVASQTMWIENSPEQQVNFCEGAFKYPPTFEENMKKDDGEKVPYEVLAATLIHELSHFESIGNGKRGK